jgi:RimJ/RimL family protein N-acetyltransferase
LFVRRPTIDDLDDVFRIHGDRLTNAHNPAGPDRDKEASRLRLEESLEHWDRFGFGYWTVQAVDTDAGSLASAVVGFAGVRHGMWLERPVLNLYYRFAPEHWGHGYGAEIAQHAVAWATSAFPDLPVVACTRSENVGSQRTAEAAGLRRRTDLEVEDEHGHVVVLAVRWPPD